MKTEEKIDEEMHEIEEVPWYRGPLRIILALFLLFIIVLMSVPYYWVKYDPNPTSIPTLEEVVPEIKFVEKNHTINSHQELTNFIDPQDQMIKQTASKVASYCKESSSVCHAKVIYYFVRDNIVYVRDPPKEYIEHAREVLYTSGSDCDGHSVLLASMLEAVGIKTRFKFIPNHVYVQAYLPDALSRYQSDGWVNLDGTCKSCDFGELGI